MYQQPRVVATYQAAALIDEAFGQTQSEEAFDKSTTALPGGRVAL